MRASRKRTLTTGGTRGIGLATGHRLAGEGHEVVLGYVRDAGVSCLTARVDVSDAGGVGSSLPAATTADRLTAVVNNARATLHVGPLAETPVDVVTQVVQINLTGALLVAAPLSSARSRYGGDGGVLVNQFGSGHRGHVWGVPSVPPLSGSARCPNLRPLQRAAGGLRGHRIAERGDAAASRTIG